MLVLDRTLPCLWALFVGSCTLLLCLLIKSHDHERLSDDKIKDRRMDTSGLKVFFFLVLFSFPRKKSEKRTIFLQKSNILWYHHCICAFCIEKKETLISFTKVFHIVYSIVGDDIECLSEIDFSMCLNETFKAFVCFTQGHVPYILCLD